MYVYQKLKIVSVQVQVRTWTETSGPDLDLDRNIRFGPQPYLQVLDRLEKEKDTLKSKESKLENELEDTHKNVTGKVADKMDDESAAKEDEKSATETFEQKEADSEEAPMKATENEDE